MARMPSCCVVKSMMCYTSGIHGYLENCKLIWDFTSLEDSFAHNIVSSIFEAVFQSDALLSYQWANGYLQGNDNGAESDQVKTGKEMQWMTNALVRRGVNDSVVCAVMLKGYTMYTYKRDIAYPHMYIMIELSSAIACKVP
ncbi:hypothetical protein V8B55DRAFT_1553453 [Mucor lusitanicus]